MAHEKKNNKRKITFSFSWVLVFWHIKQIKTILCVFSGIVKLCLKNLWLGGETEKLPLICVQKRSLEQQ